MKLIDKDALVAEIERLNPPFYPTLAEKMSYQDAIKDCIDIIYALEVKEVDLEKEIISQIRLLNGVHTLYNGTQWWKGTYNELSYFAKHFFEFGLSSQLSWKDIELIAEIGMDFMNSEDSDNLNDEEYYTEILNRFKAQKGEEYDRQ